MSSRRLLSLLVLLVLLLTPGPAHAACRSIPSFETIRKGPQIRVQPVHTFKGPEDPLKVVVVLLREYLSHAKRPEKETAVSVDVAPEGRSQFRVIALIGEKRFEVPLAFPDRLNEALVGLTETLSAEMKVPIEAKKLLPFLNETPSATAYLRYADGVLALEEKEGLAQEDVERAAGSFEEAVQSDYNYVFAYAGLAEAQAALAALTGAEALRTKAKVNMEKAKLLNPYRAKIREPRYFWYLKTRCLETP